MVSPISRFLPSRQFIQFCVAGTLAFIVDGSVVHILVHDAGLGPYLARVISIALAVLTTWLYNRYISFRQRRSANRLAEFGRYLLGNAFGLLVNYGAYALAIVLVPLTRQWPILAVAVGSLAGLGVNYLSAHHFVFRDGR